MKRSLKTDFLPGGKIGLNTAEEVQNEQSMIRAVVLNLLSNKGKDLVFPDRGTDLGWNSFSSILLLAADFSGPARFAALDTLFFIRRTTSLDQADKPDEIVLTPVSIEVNAVTLELGCKTIDGRSVSYPITN